MFPRAAGRLPRDPASVGALRTLLDLLLPRRCLSSGVFRGTGLGEREQEELFSEARKSAAAGGRTEDGREARLGKALHMLFAKGDVRREPVEEELRVLTNQKGLCGLIAGVVRLAPEEQTEFRKLILDQAQIRRERNERSEAHPETRRGPDSPRCSSWGGLVAIGRTGPRPVLVRVVWRSPARRLETCAEGRICPDGDRLACTAPSPVDHKPARRPASRYTSSVRLTRRIRCSGSS